eukprot:13518748-Ditylum_brightwellii.AAC.1
MSKLYNLNARSIDFILAYPQAEIKTNIYLFPPVGIVINTGGQDIALKFKKNLYGLKDFEADQCLWKNDGMVIIVYVDDCIIFGNSKDEVDKVVQELRRRFNITDEGTSVEEYLGVKTDHGEDGSFRMYQPHLMQRIIMVIPGLENANEHIIPASTSITLTADKHGSDRKETWHYRSVIGMLNIMAIHENATKHIVRCILTNRSRAGREQPMYGLNMKPDKSR